MKTNIQLHHKLIAVPTGKQATDPVAERHDLVLLFDCAKSNPNGDPDTGNMPRVQPDSLKGLVTDVCLKRKIRNFFTLNRPDGTPRGEDDPSPAGYAVFIRESAVLQQTLESSEVRKQAKQLFNDWLTGQADLAAKARELLDEKLFNPAEESFDLKTKSGLKDAKKKEGEKLAMDFTERKDRCFRDALCDLFFDIRFFGAVVSTEGPLKESFYGQVRGPLQFTFAESLDKALPLDATITRCAVASEKEKKQAEGEAAESSANRTMGRKFGIDYGLYRCHIHFSPAFAAKTGFSYYDLDNFLFALQHMFDDDHAAGRHLRLVGLVDFQHQSALGNAPAHKLFELVKVDGVTKEKDGKKVFASSDSEFPRSLDDYKGTPPADQYHVTKDGQIKAGKNGEGVAVITAKRIVWEIPAKQSDGKSS